MDPLDRFLGPRALRGSVTLPEHAIYVAVVATMVEKACLIYMAGSR